VDLIDTEKLYVDQLAGIIRVSLYLLLHRRHPSYTTFSLHIQKVASAWSSHNLPPHNLDRMFRSIESVYKADRSLLSVRASHLTQPVSTELMLPNQRLKDIGTNPSSPKALGDLLMRWVSLGVQK
jgi:hypothetical protein